MAVRKDLTKVAFSMLVFMFVFFCVIHFYDINVLGLGLT